MIPWAIILSGTFAAATSGATEDAIGPHVARLMERIDLAPRGDQDLCLSVQARVPGTTAESLGVARVVRGLVRAELARLGARDVPSCDGSGDARAIDRLARQQGAEWVLAIDLDTTAQKGVLRAELRAIDAGLWGSSESFTIHSLAKETIDSDVTAVPEPSPNVPHRAPSLSRLGHVSQRILALAACDLTGDGRAELIALGEELVVYRLDRPGLEVLARIAPEGLPGATTPVRDPIGGVACGDFDGDGGAEIAFGHSSFEKGRVLQLRKAPRGLRFDAGRDLNGVPLAVVNGKSLLLAKTDEGRNRWSRSVSIASATQERPLDLGAPFFDAAALGKELLLVGADYTLRKLSDLEPKTSVPAGTSGIGALLVPLGGKTSAVTTSSSASAANDRITLENSKSLSVPGRVYARAWAFSQENKATEVFLAARDDQGDQILRLSIPEEPQ